MFAKNISKDTMPEPKRPLEKEKSLDEIKDQGFLELMERIKRGNL
jgi:hypothetical protein